MCGVGACTECLQEQKGHGRDTVGKAAVPRAVDGNYHHRETPLAGNLQELPFGTGIELQGENQVNKSTSLEPSLPPSPSHT